MHGSNPVRPFLFVLIFMLALAAFFLPAESAAEVTSRVEGRGLIAEDPLDPASYINFSRFLMKMGSQLS